MAESLSLLPAHTTPTAPAVWSDKAVALLCHLDIADRHLSSSSLACLTGWIVAEAGFEVVAVGLRLDSKTGLRCNYPFHRNDARATVALAGPEALIGFNALIPERLRVPLQRLTFVVVVAPDDGEPRAFTFTVESLIGQTHRIALSEKNRIAVVPDLVPMDPVEVGLVVEDRLFNHFATRRHLTLRLDLINKCNLRCVMCHYSNELFAKRPVQRIAPEKFSAFFDPIAPITREVVLSCGDEPLMSPHFESIIRELGTRDPEVRIRFCTNGMLLSEKIAEAIIAANVYLIMFSFDGIRSETLHRIRVGSDFRRIIKNILHLKKLRTASGKDQPNFVFNFVMLDSNIHEAPLFVEVAKRLGGSYIDFRHVVQYDFYDIEHEMLEHNKPKFNYYRGQIAAAAKAAGMELYLPPPFETAARYNPAADPVPDLQEFNALVREFGEDPLVLTPPPVPVDDAVAGPVHESAHFFCDRPFSEVMIREQRDVYPCPWHKEKMGVLDGNTTLEEIFFSENFRKVRLAMLSPHGAPGCEGCPVKANYLPTASL